MAAPTDNCSCGELNEEAESKVRGNRNQPSVQQWVSIIESA
ncbi:hypothetical protein [Arthrobacter alpinus]|nr:hypothetical protein [Arthrobacter alpinus]